MISRFYKQNITVASYILQHFLTYIVFVVSSLYPHEFKLKFLSSFGPAQRYFGHFLLSYALVAIAAAARKIKVIFESMMIFLYD